MPTGKTAELERWLKASRVSCIGESEFAELRRVLSPISEGYLRKLLRKSGVALSPVVEGVRQNDLTELANSLLRFTESYKCAGNSGQTTLRNQVILAKEHARLSAHSRHATPEKTALKVEMILWLRTWLENPPLFPEWVELRLRANRPEESKD